jgi:hypothetical protein
MSCPAADLRRFLKYRYLTPPPSQPTMKLRPINTTILGLDEICPRVTTMTKSPLSLSENYRPQQGLHRRLIAQTLIRLTLAAGSEVLGVFTLLFLMGSFVGLLAHGGRVEREKGSCLYLNVNMFVGEGRPCFCRRYWYGKYNYVVNKLLD